ncbi:transporter substrate-binding domain-containing protein [Pseudomonas sp. CCM 7891]|uniref:Transporter substrate-binding domain-containing protein n=1 Tax=Pseudomonas karstica TaxID=1055468 RepID=A0A7X2RWG5_9PSED|nr:transporter substrate-binding domain-containing protein [Pseudomonas karstica]MTD22114.1 transporter substrate-binding domain-containing protein [Pseudomonas karstica]
MRRVTDQLRRNFAPTGTLRVALNHGNRVLVSRDEAGRAKGITVDIAHALAERLELPLTFVEKERAIDVSSIASHDIYDICFLAVDLERARTIDFSQPYIRIEGSYLVAPLCGTTDARTLVSEGHKVGTVEGSAYTLDLSRKAGAENLVLYPDIDTALKCMDRDEVAAIAGIRNVMEVQACMRKGARVVEPPFMEILQAIGTPVGRSEAAQYLTEFVTDMARSGRTGEILEHHGISASCVVGPT